MSISQASTNRDSLAMIVYDRLFSEARHRIASQPLLSGVNLGRGEDELGETAYYPRPDLLCNVVYASSLCEVRQREEHTVSEI